MQFLSENSIYIVFFISLVLWIGFIYRQNKIIKKIKEIEERMNLSDDEK